MIRSYELLEELFNETKSFINEKLKKEIETHLNIQKNININVSKIDEIILNTITKYYNIYDIKRKTRKRNYVTTRQMIAFFQKKFNKAHFTLQRIADLLGQDHATILHSIKTMENFAEIDKFYREQIEEIDKILLYKLKKLNNNEN